MQAGKYIVIATLLIPLISMLGPQVKLQAAENHPGKLRTYRFQQNDHARRYKLYSPQYPQPEKGPRPLVLVIHGGGSSDRGMIKLTKNRWNQLADTHGFYVVYPNAVDRLWDFGAGKTSNELDHRVDDLTYFQSVINRVSSRVPIDANRIFATGISRGGQSSYFLACKLPGRIRAIMPVAMSLPEFMRNDCVVGPPVGIAIVNGTGDPQVPYDGGAITVFRQVRDTVLSTKETIALWRARNGCPKAANSTAQIDTPGDNTSVSITEWNDCTGAPVILYKVNNGGAHLARGSSVFKRKSGWRNVSRHKCGG